MVSTLGSVWESTKNPGKWNSYCQTPVEGCNLGPEHKGTFLAICDDVGVLKEGTKTYVVCPAAADCLANPMAKPALTVSQAKIAEDRRQKLESDASLMPSRTRSTTENGSGRSH